jgi:uncharacterized repeat protein (TIGR03943 family)
MNRAAHHSHHDCGCGQREDGPAAGKTGTFVSCGLLALWGGVLLYFYGSGRIEHYLTGKGPFRVQCLLAGIGLLLLAAANFRNALRGAPARNPHGPTANATAMVAAVAVPLILATLRTPDRYSDAFIVMKSHAAGPTTPVAAVESNAPAPPAFTVAELERLSGGRTAEGNIPLGLTEVFQLAMQPADVREVLQSVRIETLGQALRDPADPTRWRLSRLLITCCAADARAVSVSVEFEGDPSQWRQLGWYMATGTLRVEEMNGGRVPVFKIDSMTPSEPPRNLMIW